MPNPSADLRPSHLISTYGDRVLIETVRECWIARARALRSSSINAGCTPAELLDAFAAAGRYEDAAKLLTIALTNSEGGK